MSMRHRPAVAEHRTNDVVDPPIVDVPPGGGDIERAPVEHAADGGISGFLYPTLWELITDPSEEVPLRSPMTMLLEQLEESPRFRRGQVVWAFDELQRALERTSHTATFTTKRIPPLITDYM